jgi:hypothetical protein
MQLLCASGVALHLIYLEGYFLAKSRPTPNKLSDDTFVDYRRINLHLIYSISLQADRSGNNNYYVRNSECRAMSQAGYAQISLLFNPPKL